ncbi:MAG: hypothetical protein RQ833_11540 [Sphingomonadaceae bacterium]|nr:hypothetical protein [Sphingomonadaceae bacterium]
MARLHPVRATATFGEVATVVAALGPAIERSFVSELEALAGPSLARARQGVPVRQGPRQATFRHDGSPRPVGGLVSLLSSRVLQDRKELRIGLLTGKALSDGFYIIPLEFGRGLTASRSRPRRRYIGTQQVVGRRAGGAKRVLTLGRYTRPYSRAISPISPDRYDIVVGRARDDIQAAAGARLIAVYDDALRLSGWDILADAVRG